jgi:hypothetical protein
MMSAAQKLGRWPAATLVMTVAATKVMTKALATVLIPIVILIAKNGIMNAPGATVKRET